MDSSTNYIRFLEQVQLLDPIKWYLKLELKDVYRQLAFYSKGWTQVHTLGANEHYINMVMLFGKSNSSKFYCRWASLGSRSCITRLNQ